MTNISTSAPRPETLEDQTGSVATASHYEASQPLVTGRRSAPPCASVTGSSLTTRRAPVPSAMSGELAGAIKVATLHIAPTSMARLPAGFEFENLGALEGLAWRRRPVKAGDASGRWRTSLHARPRPGARRPKTFYILASASFMDHLGPLHAQSGQFFRHDGEVVDWLEATGKAIAARRGAETLCQTAWPVSIEAATGASSPNTPKSAPSSIGRHEGARDGGALRGGDRPPPSTACCRN